MNYTEKLVDKLNDVLRRSYDAIQGYENAIDDMNDAQLKNFFKNQVMERTRFAGELASEITALGGEPVTESSFKAALHRAWMDLKSSIASNNAEKVLQECIRGEETASEDYKDILESDLSLPPSVTNMLRSHKASIDATVVKLKMMEKVA
ncbi:ferritin-like domain-containing protein [Roseivirga seohaensis]|uniref:DUF2383 domain-containing protein n=2 Tax=Roseivirga seohaensis TaxID=1914963 RepID=A0A0L8AMG0_9BACT|nr:PA2169 family four-helix-bundle protein [Roseivirga seohaensis]KOF03643.1 hypothetical protein OB69_04920 [Roseivirga seohaensis subsp. aquiponti]KYG81196.1 hypothetical protein AWW67_07510 [Roseivirga seohaensis]